MPSRTIHKKVIIISLLALIVAVASSVLPIEPPSFFKATLHAAGEPVWRAKDEMRSGGSFIGKLFKIKGTLVAENEALRQRITDLERIVGDHEVLEAENRALKKLVDAVPPGRNLVLSYVLAKPGQTPYDTFIVDAGRDKGIQNGDAVFVGGASMIGEILAVFADTSEARLFSSPGTKIEVLLGDKALALTAEGLGNGTFALHVPRDTEVKTGDVVLLPQRPPVFFGTVEAVGNAASDPVKIVLFRSAANAAEMKWVQIAKNTPARLEFDIASSTDAVMGEHAEPVSAGRAPAD